MKHINLMIISLVVILLNIVTFIMYGIDKRKAVKNKWRIPESTLLGMTFAFGGVGALLGMRFFRHKTKHKKFIILVPVALIMQIIILAKILL